MPETATDQVDVMPSEDTFIKLSLGIRCDECSRTLFSSSVTNSLFRSFVKSSILCANCRAARCISVSQTEHKIAKLQRSASLLFDYDDLAPCLDYFYMTEPGTKQHATWYSFCKYYPGPGSSMVAAHWNPEVTELLSEAVSMSFRDEIDSEYQVSLRSNQVDAAVESWLNWREEIFDMRLERENALQRIHRTLSISWGIAKARISTQLRIYQANQKRLQLLSLVKKMNIRPEKYALASRCMAHEVIPGHLFNLSSRDPRSNVSNAQAKLFSAPELVALQKSLPARIRGHEALEKFDEYCSRAFDRLRDITRVELDLAAMLPISNFAIVRVMFEDPSLRGISSSQAAAFKRLNEALQLDIILSLRRIHCLYTMTDLYEHATFWELFDIRDFGKTFMSNLEQCFTHLGLGEVLGDEVFSMQGLPIFTCDTCSVTFRTKNFPSRNRFCPCDGLFCKSADAFQGALRDYSDHMQFSCPDDSLSLDAPTNESWLTYQINSE